MQWYYYDNSVSVRIDVNNNLQESNENNNYYSQNINTSWLRSDLVVDNITQNRNSRTLTIKICNRWNSTLNNQNWSTRIYNNSNSTTIIKNHSTNLSQNVCIDFDVSYYEIWIAYNNYWYYEIKVETDIYNNIYESNEDNNSYIRSFNY
jgi:subtilase family serine protease